YLKIFLIIFKNEEIKKKTDYPKNH
ncbi:hypothetical protein LCGC14_1843970, partial [marine sediment metagenome]